MNEDDTYRILSRIPVEEVRKKILELTDGEDHEEWSIRFNQVLAESHWTYKEWFNYKT